jgi:hypothetical protein
MRIDRNQRLALGCGCKTAITGDAKTNLIAPRLMQPLEFTDFTISDITSEGASNLMSQKIKIGTDDTLKTSARQKMILDFMAYYCVTLMALL